MDETQKDATTHGLMTPAQRIKHIVRWIKSYARSAKIDTLVMGISGGIDSSVVSALCAQTGLRTVVVQMPIRQNRVLNNRSAAQAQWLLDRYKNVTHFTVDLTPVFSTFEKHVGPLCASDQEPNPLEQLAFANTRSRLRMMTLYQIAQSHGGLVVGTGNRVEDFGVGFFTKYGDGGVDISPIGNCMKTEVWDMGRELGILEEIITAEPTDGLWDDARTDQDQLGMSYEDLEAAMRFDSLDHDDAEIKALSQPQQKQLRRYRQIRNRNLHKMLPIPVCQFA